MIQKIVAPVKCQLHENLTAEQNWTSGQALPSSQAPFGDEAGESEEENSRLMPERRSPGLGDGRLAVGEGFRELVQRGGGNKFSAGLLRYAFQKGAMWDEGTELVCCGIYRPPNVC